MESRVVGAAAKFREQLTGSEAPSYVAPCMRMVASTSTVETTKALLDSFLSESSIMAAPTQSSVQSSTSLSSPSSSSLPVLQQSALDEVERAVERLVTACGKLGSIGDPTIYQRLANTVLEECKRLSCRDEDAKRLSDGIPLVDTNFGDLTRALKLLDSVREKHNVFSTYDTAANLNSRDVEELVENLERDLSVVSPSPSPSSAKAAQFRT